MNHIDLLKNDINAGILEIDLEQLQERLGLDDDWDWGDFDESDYEPIIAEIAQM